jgi:hypothetical protein
MGSLILLRLVKKIERRDRDRIALKLRQGRGRPWLGRGRGARHLASNRREGASCSLLLSASVDKFAVRKSIHALMRCGIGRRTGRGVDFTSSELAKRRSRPCISGDTHPALLVTSPEGLTAKQALMLRQPLNLHHWLLLRRLGHSCRYGRRRGPRSGDKRPPPAPRPLLSPGGARSNVPLQAATSASCWEKNRTTPFLDVEGCGVERSATATQSVQAQALSRSNTVAQRPLTSPPQVPHISCIHSGSLQNCDCQLIPRSLTSEVLRS